MTTVVDQADRVLVDFKRAMRNGHPWLPGGTFISNPGLDLYVQAALEQWAEDQRNRLPIVSGTFTEEEIAEIAEERQEKLW